MYKYVSKSCKGREPLVLIQKDIICTKDYTFLIDDKQFKAEELIKDDKITLYECDTATVVYHVLLDNNEWRWMQVHGMDAETMIPTWASVYNR